jgi:hypothetical protein
LDVFINKLSTWLRRKSCEDFKQVLQRTRKEVERLLELLFAYNNKAEEQSSLARKSPADLLLLHEHVNFKRKLDDAYLHAMEYVEGECSKLEEYLKELARPRLLDLFKDAFAEKTFDGRMKVLLGAFSDAKSPFGIDLVRDYEGGMKMRTMLKAPKVRTIVEGAYNQFKSDVRSAGDSLHDMLRLHSRNIRPFIKKVKEEAKKNDRAAIDAIAQCVPLAERVDRLVARIKADSKDKTHADAESSVARVYKKLAEMCEDYDQLAESSGGKELRSYLRDRPKHSATADSGRTLKPDQCGLCRQSFDRLLTEVHHNVPVCSCCHAKVKRAAPKDTCAFCRLVGPMTTAVNPNTIEWLRCKRQPCKAGSRYCAECVKFLGGRSCYDKAKRCQWLCFECSGEDQSISRDAPARTRKPEGLVVLSLFDGISAAAVALQRWVAQTRSALHSLCIA